MGKNNKKHGHYFKHCPSDITLTAKVYFDKQSSNNVRLSDGRTFANYYFYPNNLSRAGKRRYTHKQSDLKKSEKENKRNFHPKVGI
jgi:hypothetical protein